jgi:hypothetical protein
MYRYLIYGMIVESEVEFMQLVKADGDVDTSLLQNENSTGEADIRIVEKKCKEEVTEYLEKLGRLKWKYEIGLDYSCFFNRGGYYVIRDGKEIAFEVSEGFTPATVSSWLLGFAMTMALLQKRLLAVHCSAVAADDGAFLISGEPGAGKSSLTRKLLERGYKIMADDVAAVSLKENHSENSANGKYVAVYPAFPYQKLCRNEVESRNFDMDELIYIGESKDKFLVPVKEKFVIQPQKLKFMVFLCVGDVEELKVEKLAGMSQYMALRQNLFLHKLYGDWESIPEVINLSMGIAGQCPIYLIVRPKEGNSQDKMADIVEKIVAGEDPAEN